MTDKNEEVHAEEKSVIEVIEETGETRMHWLPSGIVSFNDYDAMKQAKEEGLRVRNDAEVLKGIIDNILEMEPDPEMDVSALIVNAASEFAERVGTPTTTAVKEVDHYKEVSEQAEKAVDEDFQGGCERCGFGTKEALKEYDKCPYCWEAISEPV